jgi:hypothetical protein
MSLSDYNGPANSDAILRYMVGEKIAGAYMDGGNVYLVTESGCALGITSMTDIRDGRIPPAMWVESARATKNLLDRKRAFLQGQIDELGTLFRPDQLEE